MGEPIKINRMITTVVQRSNITSTIRRGRFFINIREPARHDIIEPRWVFRKKMSLSNVRFKAYPSGLLFIMWRSVDDNAASHHGKPVASHTYPVNWIHY